MEQNKNLGDILRRHTATFGPVLDTDLNGAHVCRLDFTAANALLQQTDLRNTEAFNEAVNQMLQEQSATIGVGGYLENRFIYRRSQHFDVAAESRDLHLGIDVWLPAGTAVFAPLDGKVHSFADNANFGDYGPTIILEHELEGVTFYTLYGHLNTACLSDLSVGKPVRKGDKIAEVGPHPENGDWPPHLHFQVICSMDGKQGDYPGVARLSERTVYEHLCPNPNLILNCRHLV
ncbi:peptidoglycan DD-metalloendopeptidase family protein [Pontibacter sp. JH31]|uniref:Peptidoglycan DD-metalloendopeptidase family protein n=1 Tax=Pontibacter aquaedesilientis TaxID=2766980 RepID=A0ABR7XK89_9BACT|nr:peptidoglycan DD-metalloendopeptidase family protein [Pontibacter aquaedesilientis]MBD1398718.1 peptidoglycan DD-metalloendopeptidase family protein [Pontibacter aquaedesilientis]